MPDSTSEVFSFVSHAFHTKDVCDLEKYCYDFLIYESNWRETSSGLLTPPSSWQSLSEKERQCAKFLVQKWDYDVNLGNV